MTQGLVSLCYAEIGPTPLIWVPLPIRGLGIGVGGMHSRFLKVTGDGIDSCRSPQISLLI